MVHTISNILSRLGKGNVVKDEGRTERLKEEQKVKETVGSQANDKSLRQNKIERVGFFFARQ